MYLCAHTLVHALVRVCHGALTVFLTVLILADVCGACLAPRVLALRSSAGLQACQSRICVHAPGLLWCEAAAERTLDAVRERVCTCPCLFPCSMLPSYVSPGFSSSSSPTGAGGYFITPCTADRLEGVRLQTGVRVSSGPLFSCPARCCSVLCGLIIVALYACKRGSGPRSSRQAPLRATRGTHLSVRQTLLVILAPCCPKGLPNLH